MRFFIISLLSLFFLTATNAQIKTPVKWNVVKKQVSDKEFDIIFSAKIDKGWHVYSQFLESDEGPVATSVNFEDVEGYEAVGKAKEEGNLHEKFSKLFEMNLKYFDEALVITQRVKLLGDKATAEGYLEFMTCDDEQCLPPTPVDFSFDLAAKAAAAEPAKPVVKPEPIKKPAPLPSGGGSSTFPSNPSPTTTTTTKPPVQTQPTVTPPGKPAPKPVDGSLFPSSKNNGGSTSTPTAIPPKPKQTTTPAPKQTTKPTQTTKKETPKKETVVTKPKEEKSTGFSGFGGKNNTGFGDNNRDGDIFTPVTWKFNTKKISDTEFDLVLDAKIDKGWYVYSQYLESDEGPVATNFLIEEPKNVDPIGKAKERGTKKSGFDKMFEMDVTKFSDNLTIIQRIKVPKGTKSIKGYVEFMTCNDERCLPPTPIDFDLSLTGDGSANLGGGNTGIEASGGDKGSAVAGSSKFGDPVNDCGEKKDFSNLWLIFILGFGGGLIALLTPCVFPLIPLTVSYFTKQSQNKAKGITNAIIYGLSIIVIYVGLGMTLTLIFGPQIMNEISTNGFVNILFFVLFVIFAFSFFGYFEITLPSSWANKTDSLGDKGGLLGIFFMAFTLAIVSFSCTGPIIGTLLVQAGTAGDIAEGGIAMGPPIGMLGFAIALALPFALFAAFPGWLNSLPRSGSWMTTVKVVLGFIELALALKFLSIVDLAYHWGFLRYELFMGLWALIALGLTLYLFGFIKFPHDGPMKGLSKTRFAFGFLSMLMTFSFAHSLFTYSPSFLTSGLAPAVHYNYFNPEKGDCPLNLDCFKDYESGLAEAKRTKKPMLIDFTGYGCVNCRKMEEFVWPKPEVLKRLQKDYILISLYVDDRTKLDKKYVSDVDGKTKRTVGNKWADFQAKHFNANSQPYYVLASHDEQLLSLPKEYTPDVQEFVSFLDCGLNSFYDVCPECKRGKIFGMK